MRNYKPITGPRELAKSIAFHRAQRAYENQTPEDLHPPELTDEQLEAYKETQEFGEWMMENAGNGDWVAFEENNFELIDEMAREWLEEQEG